jgi:Protein kinase domain
MSISRPGRVIAGRYRLMVAVGSGGAGIVWRARDELLDREVAVKEIVALSGVGDEERAESYQRTLREARAAARISHPGVAGVYDVVSEDDCPYIVMELIDGRPLSAVIDEQGPLPAEQTADIGRQVLAALMAGHAAGVLHRDLKPSNVLITPAGRAVLTDFGIASLAGDPSITRTGVVLGTPGYVAPERIKGEPATPAADLWSLGATLYAAASGAGPYDGYDGVVATMFAIATTDPPGLPPDEPLRGIIAALLDRDPRLRATAADTAEALETAAARMGAAGLWAAPVAEPAVTVAEPAAGVAEPAAGVEQRSAAAEEWQPTVASRLLAAPAPGAGSTGAVRSPPPARRRGVLLAVALAGVAVVAVVTTTVILSHGRTPVAGAALQITVPTIAAEFRVAAVVTSDGSPELLARARDGSLLQDLSANGKWPGWTALPGGQVYVGVPAVATDADGQIVVFARTASGKLVYLRQTAPDGWEGPLTLGDTEVTSNPAVVTWPDKHLEVFARQADGSLGETSQLSATDPGNWSGWSTLHGNLGSAPVAALDSQGRPYVFALAQDGALIYDMDEPSGWSGWAALPGGSAFTGQPAVGTNLDGRLEVFARTRSGAVEHVWQAPGDLTRWDGPQVLISGATGDPAVFSTSSHRLELFAQGAGGTLVHTWQIQPAAGTGWVRPASLAENSDSAPAPLLVSNVEELFTRTPGGAIATEANPGAGAWSGWSELGGTF